MSTAPGTVTRAARGHDGGGLGRPGDRGRRLPRARHVPTAAASKPPGDRPDAPWPLDHPRRPARRADGRAAPCARHGHGRLKRDALPSGTLERARARTPARRGVDCWAPLIVRRSGRGRVGSRERAHAAPRGSGRQKPDGEPVAPPGSSAVTVPPASAAHSRAALTVAFHMEGQDQHSERNDQAQSNPASGERRTQSEGAAVPERQAPVSSSDPAAIRPAATSRTVVAEWWHLPPGRRWQSRSASGRRWDAR